MKKTLLLIIYFFVSAFSNAQNPTFQWAKQLGGLSDEHGNSITVDASGNVYTIGTFSGTVDFDPGVGTFTLTPLGYSDIFVSKLDASGNFVWAKAMGGATASSQGLSLVIDILGNIYTTGYFWGTVDFDPGIGTYTLVSSPNTNVFISKLDANGNFVWAKGFGWDAGAYYITIDSSGNVYTTGTFYGSGDFDPGPGTYILFSKGFYDIFVSKLDALGNFVWAKAMGGASKDEGESIAVDAIGNVYTTGYFFSTPADFDPGIGNYTLTATAASPDIFISKLDSNGNFVWAKSIGDVGPFDYGYSIAVDASGNVYTTGLFGNTVDFDPGAGVYNLSSMGSSDIFISKLNASGNFVWAKSIGDGPDDGGQSITLDATGNIYVTGYFDSDTPDFDPGVGVYTLTSIGGYDTFILKLDSSGNFIWAEGIGGSNDAIGHGISVDFAGNIYTTGYFNGTSDFDNNAGVFNLSTFGNYDVFVHKMSQSPLAINENSNTTNYKSIYPNPNNGLFNIETKSNTQITITNVIGEEILNEIFSQGKQNINIQNQASGIYFVKVLQNGVQENFKMIKD